MSYAFETQNLNVYYPRTWALRHLTVSLPQGSICGLLGRNGAGKTTLMRVLSGINSVYEGEVRVLGLDWQNHAEEIKSRIGFMPDFFPVYEELTLKDFLEHFARAYGVDHSPARLEESLARVQLQDQMQAKCKELSRGMRQRLVIAKTLLHNPELLILDEPSSGLDPKNRREIKNLILEQKRQGKTILISSHILSDLADYCDHILMIQDGQLVANNSLEKLLQLNEPRVEFKVAQNSNDVLNVLHLLPLHVEQIDQRTFSIGLHPGASLTFFDVMRALVEAQIPIQSWVEKKQTLDEFYSTVEESHR